MKPRIELITQINEVKSNKMYSLQSEITETDRRIDDEVYKLYNITKQEKKVIEYSGKNQ